MSSVTFYKYCGNGFGEERPLELGQKHAVLKEMEKNVQGYKVLRQEIQDLRQIMDQQKSQREKSKFAKPEKIRFYKSQMKVRTAKSTGALYFEYPVGKIGQFVSAWCENLYKYLFYLNELSWIFFP